MAGENKVGLTKSDYRGASTTLCAGCGHNSINNQIMSAAYELDIIPEDIVKFSGIGCSSKSPTYYLGRSFGFNSLHGRMPAVATGALFGDHLLTAVAMSGDGDTSNIGMGHFKHVMRRNLPMVYIVANNGVYGLTKGQFSATAEQGLRLKAQGENFYMPIDIVLEALASSATFVARSFAGDASQVKELIKAALSHRGIAILDIISPCVTFNNRDESHHSYSWGRQHREMIHDFNYIPLQEEIVIEEEFPEGGIQKVTMHDGSKVVLKKLDRDYDPTDRIKAIKTVQEANKEDILLTGLIFVDTSSQSLIDIYDLPEDRALNRLGQDELRPSKEALKKINGIMF
ncbi:MAG: 2-oxoacid:ferredoxin oxidoreductase subunit beta [candidate division Zixibacteria bacterium]|nr:2-oxoacid:ferredoxin oxidoreductase subunit beta [Gammaproteobacteria bacterium]NIX55838.1 2-oxoacid:ferredoxin oxidoreductase subunit beta [candidate division Zixibacteria bacterium]